MLLSGPDKNTLSCESFITVYITSPASITPFISPRLQKPRTGRFCDSCGEILASIGAGGTPASHCSFIEMSLSFRFPSPTGNLQFLIIWVDKSETLMSYWIGHSEAQNCPVRLDIRFQYALDIQVTAYSQAKEPLLLTG